MTVFVKKICIVWLSLDFFTKAGYCLFSICFSLAIAKKRKIENSRWSNKNVRKLLLDQNCHIASVCQLPSLAIGTNAYLNFIIYLEHLPEQITTCVCTACGVSEEDNTRAVVKPMKLGGDRWVCSCGKQLPVTALQSRVKSIMQRLLETGQVSCSSLFGDPQLQKQVGVHFRCMYLVLITFMQPIRTLNRYVTSTWPGWVWVLK